jgi:predicted nucleic acid-binding protein
MILVDTSVWIDYLRNSNKNLEQLLFNNQVLLHPFVIGELACGNLKNRDNFLSLLNQLPLVISAKNEEVLFFIKQYNLMGRGIGYVDAHLLASTKLTDNTKFWTLDKKLLKLSSKLSLSYLI